MNSRRYEYYSNSRDRMKILKQQMYENAQVSESEWKYSNDSNQ